GFEPAAFGFVVQAIASYHSTPHSDKAGQRGSDRAYPSRFRHAARPSSGAGAYGPACRAGGSGWHTGRTSPGKSLSGQAVAVIFARERPTVRYYTRRGVEAPKMANDEHAGVGRKAAGA